MFGSKNFEVIHFEDFIPVKSKFDEKVTETDNNDL